MADLSDAMFQEIAGDRDAIVAFHRRHEGALAVVLRD
jgi:hypothetical protein